MTIAEHIEEFAGLKVVDYVRDQPIQSADTTAYRLALDWEADERGETFVDHFASLLDDPAAPRLRALVIGDWGQASAGNDSAPVVEAIVNGRDRLSALRALFLGEMIVEESEISWIMQSDVSPLFEAFPQLEELWIRGGNDLSLGRPWHDCLKKLVIETGGMAAELVREVVVASLPALQHLELWLGDFSYGNDVTPDDLRMLFTAATFPRLRYLGLRNDSAADATASLIAEMGLPATVEVLDMSLGVLSDEGAEALIGWPGLRKLKKLDIHHHFVSPAVVTRLRESGPTVDASDAREPDEYGGEQHRYVAVSE